MGSFKLPAHEETAFTNLSQLSFVFDVIKIPLPFPTTVLCEAEFASNTPTKTTYCNRLNAEEYMRIQLAIL